MKSSVYITLIYLFSTSYGGRPRVYNALITTNQELLPSRAYPAVSPIIGHPVYLAAEIQHKQFHHVDDHQQYHEAPYEYQGQEIEENIYPDGYEDQFQGYGNEGPQQEITKQVNQVNKHNGRLLPNQPNIDNSGRNHPGDRNRGIPLKQNPDEHLESQHHLSEQDFRRYQSQQASPDHQLPRYENQHRLQEQWLEEQHEPTQQSEHWAQTTARSRPRSKQTATPTQPSQPTLPVQPPQFFNGGIPYNNQPTNIPVVPPPPLPVRIKN